MAQSIIQEANSVTGIIGAQAASRYAGATVSGAPTSGTFAVGDFIVDQTGAMYVCTVAGTPGTWIRTTTPGNSYDAYLQSLTPSTWYKLNEGSGATVVNDSSNNKINSTSIYGSITFGSAGTVLGNTSAYFSGSSTQVAMPTAYGTGFANGTNDWTVTGWINATGTSNAVYATGAFSGTDDAVIWGLVTNGSGYNIQLNFDGADSYNFPSPILTTGSWNFIAITFNRTTKVATLYVNGSYVTTRTFTGNPNITSASSSTIGGVYGGFFNGYISEIANFNYQLSANQIQTLYNAASNPQVNLSVNENIAGKNLVINGGMDIWQRGTSITIGSTSTYAADRWMDIAVSPLVVTVTQQAAGLTGFQYASRVQRQSGNTSTNGVYYFQSLETQNSLPLAGQTVTLSFWAKAGANFSSSTSQITAQVTWGTGTDQNVLTGFTGASNFINQTPTLTTSWQRFTYTGTVSSSATQVGLGFYYTPSGTAGANDWFQITGVQLEIAAQATPFSRAGGSIGGELALCQRYYYSFAYGNAQPIGGGFYISAQSININLQFPVQMRTTPTLNQSYGSGYYKIYSYSNQPGDTSYTGYWVLAETSSTATRLYNQSNVSSQTAGQGCYLLTNNASAYLGAQAEL